MSCRGTTKERTGVKDYGGIIIGDNDRGKKKILPDPKAAVFIDRIDPKAAVMDMLEKSEREKKKTNREIWRKGMLDRVRKENVPVEHWGTINSGNFKIMIGECAPHGVRVVVVKDLGSHEVGSIKS